MTSVHPWCRRRRLNTACNSVANQATELQVPTINK